MWRFDPVAVTPELSLEDHMEAFTECADRLAGRVRACVISFAPPYGKVARNFRKEGREGLVSLSIEKRRDFARALAAEAGGRGIRLMACCNEDFLQPGVGPARCVDGGVLAGLFGPGAETGPGPTRKGCGCSRSVDIGSYDTCPHGCVYCYANTDREKAIANVRAHRPGWNGLGFHVEGEGAEEAEENPQGRLF